MQCPDDANPGDRGTVEHTAGSTILSSAHEASVARSYWESADSTFSHIDYTNFPGQDRGILADWEETWLRQWDETTPLKGMRVADYGIGAGLLGDVLLSKYEIGHYIGIDIAQRQLDSAASRLTRRGMVGRFELLMAPTNFSALRADALVSQAVIQHFPSRKYFVNWICSLASARIPYLMLQVRNVNDQVAFAEWTDKAEMTPKGKTKRHEAAAVRLMKHVTRGTFMNCDYLLQWLKASGYSLSWTSFRINNETRIGNYQSCSFKHTGKVMLK